MNTGQALLDEIRNAKLFRGKDGRYYSDSPFMNAMIQIESKGHPTAVSPTGARGLLQFTGGTGKAYGLIGNGDRRNDPYANFEAGKRYALDNAAHFAKQGLDIVPTALYLGHQQGAGGATQIMRAMRGQGELDATVRRNLGLNNAAGKSPAQVWNMWANKIAQVSGTKPTDLVAEVTGSVAPADYAAPAGMVPQYQTPGGGNYQAPAVQQILPQQAAPQYMAAAPQRTFDELMNIAPARLIMPQDLYPVRS